MQTITQIGQESTASNGLQLADLIERLINLLRDDGMPDPLGERLLLAAVLADLYGLAALPVPTDIQARIGT